MSARDDILRSIRAGLARGPAAAAPAPAVAHVVPERGRKSGLALASLFIAEAEAVQATVRRCAGPAAVPVAVASYFEHQGILPKGAEAVLRLAPDSRLGAIPWHLRPDLRVGRGPLLPDDPAAAVIAFAGIAETGTVMLLSGPTSPTTYNFLPDTHVVLLHAADLVGTYEEAWEKLARAQGGALRLPRAVNWVTGPSRTADIEQTLLLGAHGPRRLLIVLIDAGRA